MSEQISTGISGLDTILRGGITAGHAVLVQGTPGAGKTTLGLQFIYQGALRHNQAGLVITFEEFPQQIYHDALKLGFDLKALEAQNKLRVISTSPAVLHKQIQEGAGIIQRLVADMKVERILVDSITHFQRITTDPVALRDLLNSFLNSLRQGGFTTMLTQEVSHEETEDVTFEQYIVDCVIRLSFALVNRTERIRTIEILKCRGQGFLAGKHSVEISEGGMRVFPRPEPVSRLTASEEEGELKFVPGIVRAPTGIVGLDRMLEGGLIDGFSTLVTGDSGAGKSILALQFIDAGIKQGEKGLYVALREDYEKVLKTARSMGIDLEALIAEGKLTFLSRSPVKMNADALYWELYEMLQSLEVKRAVIDSLTDLQPSIDDPNRFRDYVYALVDLFSARQITSIFTSQDAGGSGDQELVESELSMVFDAIIALRLRRIQDHIRKTIVVLKLRGSSHDTGIRQFKITNEGIVVQTQFEGPTAFIRQLQKV
jgi:circadian clock protein KaiC